MIPHVLSDRRFAQGESPRWDSARAELLWVDMATSTFHSASLGAEGLTVRSSVSLGERIGCAAPIDGEEGWVVAAGRGFHRVSPDGTVTTIAAGIAPEPTFMNDGGCDPAGRFWAGTQAVPREPTCSLYSLEPDGSVVQRLNGVTVSNGLAFSADGRTLYYIDTLPHRSIEAFDVAPDGTLSARRLVARVSGGNPDGMAIDDDGCLWVAVWDASEVHRYSPRGALLQSIRLPVRRPTAVAFVGTTLIVTSASVGLAEPNGIDGALLAIDVGIGGPPAAAWRPS